MKLKLTTIFTLTFSTLLLSCNSDSSQNDKEDSNVLECTQNNSLSTDQSFYINSVKDAMVFLKNSYKEINGEVIVTNMNDLSFLNCLEKVKYLKIDNCNIKNLEGLSSLKSIDGLYITGMPILTSLKGLNTINEIKYLNIRQNPILKNLEGLESLKMLGGVFIENNKNLENLKGLENVSINFFYDNPPSWSPDASIWRIENNSNLTSISSLNNIVGELKSNINIYLCPKLIDLGVFNSITKASGITVNNCSNLSSIYCFPNITHIGSIGIYSSNNIKSISFPSLKTASYIGISGNNTLDEINFNSLTQISGPGNGDFSMHIEENKNLKTLNGFDKLEHNSSIIDININAPGSQNPLENICALRKLFLNKIINNANEYKINFRTKCSGFLGGHYVDISQFDNICNCN